MDDVMKSKLEEAARLLNNMFNEGEAVLVLIRKGDALEILRSHYDGNSNDVYQEMLDIAKELIEERDYVMFEPQKSN